MAASQLLTYDLVSMADTAHIVGGEETFLPHSS